MRLGIILAVSFATCLAAPARGAAESERAPEPEAGLEAEGLLSVPEFDGWFSTGRIGLSAGQRDNLLLSAFAPVDSWFGRVELEAMTLRSFGESWTVVGFLSGEVLRYVSPEPETKGEQQWMLHAEARFTPVSWLQLSLAPQGYYQDMVLDLSSTEAVREVAPLETMGFMSTASSKISLPWGFALTPTAQAHLSDFREYPGDYQELKWGIRSDWTRSEHLTVAASWFQRDRDYDERTQFTTGGRPLPGTRLEYQIREWQIKAGTTWKLGIPWTLTGTFGALENRDNGSGFFDYDRKLAAVTLVGTGGNWSWSVSVRTDDDTYVTQTVGTGIAPPARESEGEAAEGRVEYRAGKSWVISAEVQRDRRTSNEAEFAYSATTILAGLRREF